MKINKMKFKTNRVIYNYFRHENINKRNRYKRQINKINRYKRNIN